MIESLDRKCVKCNGNSVVCGHGSNGMRLKMRCNVCGHKFTIAKPGAKIATAKSGVIAGRCYYRGYRWGAGE